MTNLVLFVISHICRGVLKHVLKCKKRLSYDINSGNDNVHDIKEADVTCRDN